MLIKTTVKTAVVTIMRIRGEIVHISGSVTPGKKTWFIEADKDVIDGLDRQTKKDILEATQDEIEKAINLPAPPNPLKVFSDEQLEAEIERRSEKSKGKESKKPKGK